MPVGAFHRVEHGIDEAARHLLVEQVAHRIDEDHARPTPGKRLAQPLRPKREVEAALERMAGHSAKPLGEALGIATIAAGADLAAPGYRIPSRIRPFDRCVIGHDQNQNIS